MSLKECTTKELFLVRDELETALKIITNACRVRKSVLDYSVSDYQSMLIDRKTNPSSYYLLRYEDKEISLVADLWRFNPDGSRSKANTLIYHIHCENCRLNTFERTQQTKKDYHFDRSQTNYLSMDNFDVALSYWKKACFSFITDIMNLKIQGDLF